ncbi:multidrug and toxin extrusion protein 1-like [Rhinophrynus dorsalis]
MEDKEQAEDTSRRIELVPGSDPEPPQEQIPEATGCMQKIRQYLPGDVWHEARQLVALAAPTFLSQLMIYMISTVSSIFCGHLGKVELDAVSLATAVINITGIAIGTGLAGACDTLMSQTYGGRNLKFVGTILQRGILILLLFCFPCWALFINTESILLLFRQDPEVSRLTQKYVLIFLPALPATFLYQLQAKYLQNQGIVLPQVLTGFTANLFNALINYVFLYVMGLGVMGSACANTMSQFIQMILLFIYIVWRKLYTETWGGWSRACFEDWGSFIRLAIPSMLMMCIEWWAFEIGIFLAGAISVIELGAQTIIFQIANIVFMVPSGISIAVCIRVGHGLGAGNIKQTKTSCAVAILVTEMCALGSCILISSLRNVLAYIFTTDKDILELVSYLVPVYAACLLCDGCVATCGGILRGSGKQKIGAIFHTVGYYVIGLPVGISLMFAAKLGAIGFWFGILLCSVLQGIALIVFVFRIDWKKASDEAQVRAMLKIKMSKDLKNQPAVYPSAPPSEDPEHAASVALMEVETGDNHISEPSGNEAPTCAVTQHKKPLSNKQLIVRRTTALACSLGVLMVGILVRFTVQSA